MAESLYILISGRVRLLRADPDARMPIHVEEEVLFGALNPETLCQSIASKQACAQCKAS